MQVSVPACSGPAKAAGLCPQHLPAQPSRVGCTIVGSRLTASFLPKEISTSLLGQQPSSRRGRRCIAAPAAQHDASDYVPYPYNEQQFHRVQIAMVIAPPATGEGTIVLMREDIATGAKMDRDFCMCMNVAGDTLLALHSHLHGQRLQRPGALDLLWTVLMRGQRVSKREWKLVRGAVVELQGKTFVGRLFFGDSEGHVVWDCDCRPSDALYMTMRAGAPMYINKPVYDECKMPTRYLVGSDDRESERSAAVLKVLTGSPELPELPLSGKEALVTPRKEDPEPVKRLKREMAVALAEEDYEAATRIRDHPFMKQAMEVLKHRQLGSDSEADRLLSELNSSIAADNERHAQEYQQQRSRSQL